MWCVVFWGTIVQAEQSRPNIVFAFADDWGRYASVYGKLEPGGINDLVSTPNFDRVAEEGVLFTNAFVNAPSCTPCRSSLLTGQHFWRTGRGAILQGAIWDETIPSYPHLLRDSGYHIGHTYKVWSPGTPVNAPYGGRDRGFNKAGSKFNGFSQYVSKQKDADSAKGILYSEVRNNFRQFITARPDDEVPFCYWFGPTNCHRKWVRGSGKKLWGIDPDKLKGKLPPFLPDVPIVREDIADYLGEVQAFDAGLGVLLAELEEMGELERTIVVVSGDHGIPGFPYGKCNLYDFGVHVPLAIRWGKEIPRGRVVSDFVSLPDLAPTFLEAGGVEIPDTMTARSLVSVLKSEKAGQVDPQRDAVYVGRERHVASVRDGNKPYPQRAIRTADYLYIRNFEPGRWPMGDGPGFGKPVVPFPNFDVLSNNTFAAFGDMDASPSKAWLIEHRDDDGMGPMVQFAFGRRPAEELYDLKSDPHQIHNLASSEKYKDVAANLSRRLLSELRRTGDSRVIDEAPKFESTPFTDPNRKRRKP